MSKDIQTQGDKLQILMDVAQELTAERDLDRLLDLIMTKATEVMDCDRSTLYLIDWDQGKLWSKIAQGAKPIRLEMGHGIAGQVAETGEVYNTEDVYRDARFDRTWDEKNFFRTKTMLCVPMVDRQGERIGLIQCINKKIGIFETEDEEILRALASQAAVAIENAQHIEDQRRLLHSVMISLASTVDHRDYITGGHTRRVTMYTLVLAKALGTTNPKDLQRLEYAGLLHDYGKIGVPEAVLTKPGKLTDEEYKQMQMHVVYTREILSQIYFPKDLVQVPFIAAQHHEKINGKGYPDGLKGDEITFGGKIMAVADVFDALSANRQYRGPMPLKDLLALFQRDKGAAFEPEIVDSLFRSLPEIREAAGEDHWPPGYWDGADEILAELGVEVPKTEEVQYR